MYVVGNYAKRLQINSTQVQYNDLYNTLCGADIDQCIQNWPGTKQQITSPVFCIYSSVNDDDDDELSRLAILPAPIIRMMLSSRFKWRCFQQHRQRFQRTAQNTHPPTLTVTRNLSKINLVSTVKVKRHVTVMWLLISKTSHCRCAS